MSEFTAISTALDDHISAYAAANSLDVALENEDFKPAVDTLYLRATQLAGSTEPTGIDNASDDHIGIYQIDVITPSNRGKNDAMVQADLIADHFKRGTLLTNDGQTVRIEAVSRSNGSRDGAWYVVSVSARYRAFTPAR